MNFDPAGFLAGATTLVLLLGLRAACKGLARVRRREDAEPK